MVNLPSPPTPAGSRAIARSRLRHTVERLLVVLLAALVLRTWYFEGLFVPLKVSSGSMAGTLSGLHREMVCGDCGHRFDCGSDVRPVSSRAVCPNCGYARNDLGVPPDIAGDRLLVHKSIFAIRLPRRWEVVAFRHPHQPGKVCVKRAIGLPGESVRIRDGDVYVDGEIQRKPPARHRAMAVLVYDANFPPGRDPSMPPRWEDDGPGSGWGSANGRFAHASTPGEESIDWLTYRHWVRLPGADGKVREAPITNQCGYNQTPSARAENVHPVGDVLLSFRLVRAFGQGRLLVELTDGREQFRVRIDPRRRCYEVLRGGRPLDPSGREKPLPQWTDELLVEASLFDRQLLLAFDGRRAVAYRYAAAEAGPNPTSRPLAIGSQGLGVEIRDLRVYRDVYYTGPPGLDGRWGLDEPVRLGKDEYFVLGDNSTISRDSRTWPEGPAVPARLLIGRPFVVHFPSRPIDLGRWHFQVPDPGEIRYIR